MEFLLLKKSSVETFSLVAMQAKEKAFGRAFDL